jgi:uncharacterized protein (UPF0332 family)
MNPRDFLEVADELAAGTREAEWRSAVSRAYYAAFHQTRNVLRQFGFSIPVANQAHAYLWLRLANSGQPDLKQAGADLNNLRSMRNRADYDLEQPFLHAVAIGQVAIAEKVIQVLETVITLPHLVTQVIETIQVYERDVLRQVTWRPA